MTADNEARERELSKNCALVTTAHEARCYAAGYDAADRAGQARIEEREEQLRAARDLLKSATDAPWLGFNRQQTYDWHMRKDAFIHGLKLPDSSTEIAERDLKAAREKIAELELALRSAQALERGLAELKESDDAFRAAEQRAQKAEADLKASDWPALREEHQKRIACEAENERLSAAIADATQRMGKLHCMSSQDAGQVYCASAVDDICGDLLSAPPEPADGDPIP